VQNTNRPLEILNLRPNVAGFALEGANRAGRSEILANFESRSLGRALQCATALRATFGLGRPDPSTLESVFEISLRTLSSRLADRAAKGTRLEQIAQVEVGDDLVFVHVDLAAGPLGRRSSTAIAVAESADLEGSTLRELGDWLSIALDCSFFVSGEGAIR
jgi:hypothetical protein